MMEIVLKNVNMKKMRNTIIDNVNGIKNKVKDDFSVLTVGYNTKICLYSIKV